MGMEAILAMTWTILQTFVLPFQGDSIWNLALIGQAVSKEKMFEIVDDPRHTTTTDAGAWVYYKLTL